MMMEGGEISSKPRVGQTSGKLSPKTQFDGAQMLVFAVRCGLCEILIWAEKVAGCSYQGRF